MIASITLALLLTGTDQAALHAAAASICEAFPLRTTGTIHYFCDCQAGAEAGCAGHAGNDANDGLTQARPKRTWAAVVSTFGAMAGGDTIALCRGGAWLVAPSTGAIAPDCSNNFSNSRCASGSSLRDPANASTCDVRDYSPSWGGTRKPLIAADGTGSIRFINRYGAVQHGVRILNLDFRGNGLGPNLTESRDQIGIATGLCADSTDDGWLVCGNTFRNLRMGFLWANGGSTWNHVDLYGNEIRNCDQDGALINAGDDNTIEANLWDNNGGVVEHPISRNNAHMIYLAGQGSAFTSHNLRLIDNLFLRTDTGTLAPCATAMVVAHHWYDGLLIENNVIDGGSNLTANCWGIDFRAAQSPDTGFLHMTVRRNRINSGGVAVSIGQAPGVLIESNVITMPSAGWKVGIMSPHDVSRPGQDATQNDTQIRNNTIWMAQSGGTGIMVLDEGTGHVVANNAVRFEAGGTCFSTPLASSAHAFIGDTACSGYGTWGTTYDATTHVTADPLFVSAPSDLSLQAASPLRGAGDPSHAAALDFQGRARPTPPSIGAYDVGGSSSSGSSGGSSSGGGSSSSGSSSSGGSTGGGGGSRAGCGTSGEAPGALAGLMLLALLGAGRRARFRP